MAKETVNAVRQAELNAMQLEKEAVAQKEAIQNEAQQNAKVMITSMTREAIAKADKDLNNARLKGTEIVEAAKVKAEKEVLLIKEMIKGKEQEALKHILSSII